MPIESLVALVLVALSTATFRVATARIFLGLAYRAFCVRAIKVFATVGGCRAWVCIETAKSACVIGTNSLVVVAAI